MRPISQINESELFQKLCKLLFTAEYSDFQAIDDSAGDNGNDGYTSSNAILFAMYCPEKPRTEVEYKAKISSDLKKAVKLRDELGYKIDAWVFVTPGDMREQIHRFITEECEKVGFVGSSWGETKITEILSRHENVSKQFPDLIIPDIIAEVKKGTNDVLSKIEEIDSSKKEYADRVNSDYTKRIDAARDDLNAGLYVKSRDAYLKIIQDLKVDRAKVDANLFFRSYNNLGITQRELDDLEDSVKSFEEALIYKPNDIKSLANLAHSQTLVKDFKSSLETIEKALVIDPNDDHSIRVKGSIFAMQKDYKSAIDFLKPHKKDDAVMYYEALDAMDSGEKEKANSFFKSLIKEHPGNVQFLLLASQNILISQHEYFRDNFNLPTKKSEEVLKDMEQATIWLKEARDILLQQEQTSKLAAVYTNLSAAYLALGQYEDSIENANEALRIDKNESLAYLNRGRCYFKQDSNKNALADLIKYAELTSMTKENARDIAMCYKELGDISKAKEVLIPFLKEDFGNDDMDIIGLAIDIFNLNLDHDLSEKYLGLLESRFPTNPLALRIRARFLENRNQPGAEELLKEGLKVSDPFETVILKMDLAYISYKNGQYEEALALYKTLSNDTAHTYANNKYLECLYHLGKYAEALEFIEKLNKNTGYSNYVTQITAAIQMKLGNLQVAADLYKTLYQNDPNNLEFLVNYGICIYRLDKADEAIKAFDGIKNKITGAHNLLPLAHGYEIVGKVGVALELAYKALQEEPGNPKAHLGYVGIFLKREQKDDSSIEEKYVKAFQDSMNNFNEKFPEEQGLVKMEDDDKFTKMFSTIDQVVEHTGQVQDLYKKNLLPLYSVTTLTGKDIFTVWAAFSNTKDVGIRIAIGNQEEKESESKTFASSSEVVVDILSLYTLSHLDKLDLLTSLFDKIYVHQSVLDELIGNIDEYTLIAKKGLESIGKIDGQYARTKIEPEDAKKNLAFFEKIKAFVKDKCIVTGLGKEYPQEEKELLKIAGNIGFFSSKLAEEKNIAFMSDDGLLRGMLRKEKGSNSFSSLVLLNGAKEKQFINKTQYNESIVTLLKMRYQYISIDSDFLEDCLKKNAYSLEGDFEVALDQLAKKETMDNSIAIVISDVLAKLWINTDLLPTQRKLILQKIMNAISVDHDIDQVARMIGAGVKVKANLTPYQIMEILRELLFWVKISDSTKLK
ncbi:tetratricopeptide repeat protein [Candidatus Nomurabacteria bacterium]|nr:tetratricopeptide repeat protein [Candidatus Nomurabacteria bacterium]